MSREREWRGWFSAQGWEPLSFQTACWEALQRGESGLLHLPTGAGKTYAAYGGAVLDALDSGARGLRILYVTPLRALARAIEKALRAPIEALAWPLTIGARTGDTSGHTRAKQRRERPNVLVTTPESLALLLSYESAADDFCHLRTLILDEWHELLGTKRGSLLELSAARLRTLAPGLRTWALSATLANPREAAEAAVGRRVSPTLITAPIERAVRIETLIPESVECFPWAGHLGLRMLAPLIERLDRGTSTLVFTNTRSQAERWYQAVIEARPDLAPVAALHHGSLEREERERVESGLKSGAIRIAVCTSSLDLGIDLAPVEQVVQIGSPKGIARLIQRAGRAAHAPGKPCTIVFVPTHALELLEIAAARRALAADAIEPRTPLPKPLDVLSQHLVTLALGGGFEAGAMLAEVKTAYGFRDLTDPELQWTLALVRDGGHVLHAYPDYRKIVVVDGRYTVTSSAIARRHRLNIGTIVSDATILVRYRNGAVLGSVEESYIARLRPGERFLFAGKVLELVLVRDLVAYVRNARARGPTPTPKWSGGKFPISASLASALRDLLGELRAGMPADPEIRAAAPVLEAQAALSRIPGPEECLVELCATRAGAHCYLFPFEGRLVHEGLAALLAYRLGCATPATFSLAVNDYGIEILGPLGYRFGELLRPEIFSTENLVADFLTAVNLSELARRRFREIARVAGLVMPNLPGRERSSRQLQASSALIFDVFARYEPENLLLQQARREVVEQHFEQTRLVAALERLGRSALRVAAVEHPTPLAFPLVVERMSAKLLSTETLEERVRRMIATWEPPAWKTNPPVPSALKSPGKRSNSYRRPRSSGRHATP